MKKEFSNLSKNKGMMLGMIVIMLIPFVYSFFFLTSAWDPYGNTGKIPVAVVNEDQPATLQGNKISAGADTIKKLKDDHQLSWNFVSKAEAEKGLRDNKYYTVITIPKDFSKNAATVLDSSPKKMNLKYETNGSLNYISEVISQVGTGKLNDQIKEKVTSAFVSQLFGKINEIGSKLKLAADGSKQLEDGLGTLKGGLKTYTGGVSQVNGGIGQLYAKVPTLASGISQLTDGGSQLYGGLNQLNGKVPTLVAGVNKLTDGGDQLHNGLGQLNGQVPTLANGIHKLNDGGLQLKDGLTQLHSKIPDLTNGVEQLTNGLNQVHDNVSGPSVSGADTLSSGVTKLNNGIKDLSYYTMDSRNGNPNLPDGVTLLKTKLEKLITKINAQVGQLTGFGIMTLENGRKKENTASDEQDKALTALNSVVGQIILTDDDRAALETAVAELSTTKTNRDAAESTHDGAANLLINQIKTNLTTEEIDSEGDPKGLVNGINMMIDKVTTLDNELSHPEISKHPAYADAVSQLKDGLGKLNKSVNEGEGDTPSLVSAMNQLNDGMNQLHGQVPTLSDGVTKLYDGSNQLSDGLVQLDGKVPDLALGIGRLYDGSAQLYAGLEQLQGNTPTLAGGVSQLFNGSGRLYSGLQQLNGNVPALSDGVSKLNDGTNQLVANNNQLLDGAGKLSDGSTTLADGLSKGYEQVAETKLSNLTAKMFANPTQLSQKRLTTVPNYGAALAPFVLAMALFIGIIIFNFAYSFSDRPTEKKQLINWIGAKLLISTGFAVGSAVLEAFLIRLAGLHVDNLIGFYGIAVLFGISAMFVTMLFNLVFGKPGIFVALGLLTLSGSGGLFPMETVAPWFSAIQKFLPMTYAMNGFRSTITGGIASTTVTQSIIILLAVTLLSLLLMFAITLTKMKKELPVSEN